MRTSVLLLRPTALVMDFSIMLLGDTVCSGYIVHNDYIRDLTNLTGAFGNAWLSVIVFVSVFSLLHSPSPHSLTNLFPKVACLGIAFYMLGTSTEDYFCPTLTIVSKNLKMSPSLAVSFLIYSHAHAHTAQEFFELSKGCNIARLWKWSS